MKSTLTIQDKIFIRDNYPKLTINKLSKMVNNTWLTVNKYLIDEGIKQIKGDKPWSDCEIKALQKLAKKYKIDEIAKTLNKTEESIEIKCNQLNIVLEKNRKEWTDTQINKLEDLWGKRSIEKIAKKLGKTVNSVRIKAVRLGLPSIIDSIEDIKAAEFCRFMGINYQRLYTLEKKGLKINKTNVTENKYYKTIKLQDAIEFIEKNLDLFDGSKIQEGLFIPEPQWLKNKRRTDTKNKDNIKHYLKQKPWSDAEKKKLIEYRQKGLGNKDIALILDRPLTSVRKIVTELGLSYRGGNYWAMKDLIYLRDNYKFKTYKQIGDYLGRTEKSVTDKCIKLGYKKRKNLQTVKR